MRVGASLDEAISDRVYDALVGLPLKAGNRGDGLQSLRHLDNLRTFLSGMGPIALFDLPWIPLYLAICFAFHTLIGAHRVGRRHHFLCAYDIDRGLHPQLEQTRRRPRSVAKQPCRNEPAQCRGSRRDGNDAAAWRSAGARHNRKFIASQQKTSDVAGGFASTSKVLRMVLQSAVLAVGAYLVINQQATAGIIIAGSILSARALAPVDLAIANWKGFIAARQSWRALNQLLDPLSSAVGAHGARGACNIAQRQRRKRCSSRSSAAGRKQHQLCPQCRQRPRHHRPKRLGKVEPCTAPRRRLAAGARQSLP